jgi:hypothetical protein
MMGSGVEAALTPHSHPPWIPVTCSIFLTSQRFWRRDQKICIDGDRPDQIDCADAGLITASDCVDGNHVNGMSLPSITKSWKLL